MSTYYGRNLLVNGLEDLEEIIVKKLEAELSSLPYDNFKTVNAILGRIIHTASLTVFHATLQNIPNDDIEIIIDDKNVVKTVSNMSVADFLKLCCWIKELFELIQLKTELDLEYTAQYSNDINRLKLVIRLATPGKPSYPQYITNDVGLRD